MPAVIVMPSDRERESFADPACGDVTWVTLISGDVTKTSALSAGIADLPPGGTGLALHRHAPAEIYHVISGTGALTVDGVTTRVSGGTTVFIPGDAEHGICNVGDDALRFFYVFPNDRFSDVVYRFSGRNSPR